MIFAVAPGQAGGLHDAIRLLGVERPKRRLLNDEYLLDEVGVKNGAALHGRKLEGDDLAVVPVESLQESWKFEHPPTKVAKSATCRSWGDGQFLTPPRRRAHRSLHVQLAMLDAAYGSSTMFLTNMLAVRSQQRIRPAGDMDKATANVVPAEAGEGGHGGVPVEGSGRRRGAQPACGAQTQESPLDPAASGGASSGRVTIISVNSPGSDST